MECESRYVNSVNMENLKFQQKISIVDNFCLLIRGKDIEENFPRQKSQEYTGRC
jgi:hypothetical protein